MNLNKILVLNCGSSSIKFAVLDPATGRSDLHGLVERLGFADARLIAYHGEHKSVLAVAAVDVASAVELIFTNIADIMSLREIVAVGHRVVHGGDKFTTSQIITDAVLLQIAACIPLAPLHNSVNLAGIKVAQKLLPDVIHVACFDTAFHQTMSADKFLYPVPYAWYVDYAVRKYGFHGTSHNFISATAIERYKLDSNDCGLVTVHLGGGCSLCAIANGRSVDTTMGMTPLDGLMMGTRAGSIDPGIHAYIAEQAGLSLAEVTEILNKKSGLYGVSNLSSDMRDLHVAAAQGNAQASIALKLFYTICAKQIALMITSLHKIDGIIFTGGIGENDKIARREIVMRLKLFGFNLDDELNESHGFLTGGILNKTQPFVAVIKTNEEWQIARETQSLR
jgi:acetate kinase